MINFNKHKKKKQFSKRNKKITIEKTLNKVKD